ncbi:MAG: hypothetical protein QW728_00640 [Thermoplasmata archaeon]
MVNGWMIALYVVVTFVVAVILFYSTKLICRDVEKSFSFMARCIGVALIAILVIPLLTGGVAWIQSKIHWDGLSVIALLIGYIAFLYSVRYIIVSAVASDEWRDSIWISFIATAFMLLINSFLVHFHMGIRLTYA